MQENTILVTGGSGLLGRELAGLLPGANYPSHADFDVSDLDQMTRFVAGRALRTVLHAAAFTSPPVCDREPERALVTNIIGTANVARLCLREGLKLIYVSTDYVFSGEQGGYREDDPVLPVNKYAWSKLGGECAARMLDRSLILRTSFGPNRFPYEKAFTDQFTSRQSVREIAKKIVRVLRKDETRDLRGVLHLGGKRQTVHEYATGLDPSREIGRLSIHDVNFRVPVDTSLSCERYAAIFETGEEEP